MYLAIRGGIVNCSQRMSIANNPYCPNYEEKEEMRTIMWYDVNNLYGFAMQSHLPLREFEFVEDVDIQTILNTADDADYGYMVRTFSLLIIILNKKKKPDILTKFYIFSGFSDVGISKGIAHRT